MTDAQAAARFASTYHRPATVVARAPGRVNLIGEHTDYNDGYVMPSATPQQTMAAVAARDDMHVRLWSTSVPAAQAAYEYDLATELKQSRWGDYVQGVTAAMRAAGLPLRGFEACLASDVPLGAGLSSSASLEIACVRALARLFELPIDNVQAARLGQAAEVDFVGAPVGIMDQMAASLCSQDEALFLDTQSLDFERVPLPAAAELLVIDSGQRHQHASGGYRVRRQECRDAVRLLGVPTLRALSVHDLHLASSLPAPLDRRVRHVLTENVRVCDMRDALRNGDLDRAGRLMQASHASMRDDYEVSTPAIDRLVDLAGQEDGVFGARLTGGGFGGSIVALVARGRAREVGARVVESYRSSGHAVATVRIPDLA